MRFERLDLIRYGKFTERSVALPAAPRDFHLIIGPNEAGKSTLRSAIVDLLYGIPLKTPHAFVHAMPELRLGARLAQAGLVLEMRRAKGNKQTLRDAADQPLPDGALAPYLGASDREFFAQMFGLDHERLLKGGHSLLDAADDLGQILFQSAAGIAGLGELRDALETEADKLWSKRRSGERSYYQALDELERAGAALKLASLRTRDWTEAQAHLAALEASHEQLRRQHAEVKQRRSLLERLRRVVPRLADWDAATAQIEAMGPVAELPEDAARALAEAERILATTQVEIDHQRDAMAQAQDAMLALEARRAQRGGHDGAGDAELHAAGAEITELNEQRQQYRAHPRDIAQRQAEVDAQWQLARGLAAELGWDVDQAAAEAVAGVVAGPGTGAIDDAPGAGAPEADAPARPAAGATCAVDTAGTGVDAAPVAERRLRSRLPPAALRAALARLLRMQASLEQALQSAERAHSARQADGEQARAQLAALPATEAPLALQAALAQAQRMGDLEAVLRDRRQVLRQRQSALEAAEAALGQWRSEIGALRAMSVPDPDVVKSFAQEQVADELQARSLTERIAAQAAQLGRAQLDVEQYRSAHDPVSWDDVAAARQARDEAWAALQASSDGAVQPTGSPTTHPAQRERDFERLLAAADSFADRRHDTVQQAAELRARQARQQGAAQDLALLQQQERGLQAAGELRALRWARLASDCGLPALPFQAAGPWLAGRATVLLAHAARDEAADALAELEANGRQARAALAAELQGLGVPSKGADLAVLMLHAEDRLRGAAEMEGQRKTLAQQLARGERELQPLAEQARLASEALQSWAVQWAAQWGAAGFAPALEPATAEALLQRLEGMASALEAMRVARAEVIEVKRAELQRHAEAARSLAERLAPSLAGLPAPEIATGLAARLATARDSRQEAERLLAAIDATRLKLADARLRQQQAEAALAPLRQRAGVQQHDALVAAVAASDRLRQLLATRRAAETALHDSSDGVQPGQLRAQAAQLVSGDAGAMTALVVELDELADRDQTLVDQLAELAATRQAATSRLQAMGGAADGAAAEARRQQALARMADTVERYVKVFTAARLLRWAIEQYREARQGPMLAAASRVFAGLTLGSFEKLTVDFESQPLKLRGRRPDGAEVEIEGMSEGTRDQLFLALRLAALDMHLDATATAHGPVLPFVADDLFINYDDRRSAAGLHALGELSRKTQVLFLSHHEHLLPVVRDVFGEQVNVVRL